MRPSLIDTKHPAAVAVLEIPLKVCGITLDSLLGNSDKHCSHEFDATVVAYAMFDQIRSKLMGNPTTMGKMKLTNMTCSSVGDSFVISLISAPRFSFAARVALNACKQMRPAKLYKRYSQIVRVLQEKADKSAFNDAVSRLVDGIKSMSICFVGKMGNVDNAKLDKFSNDVNKALKDVSKADGPKGKRDIDLTNSCDAELNLMSKVQLPKNSVGCLIKCYIRSHIPAGVYNYGSTLYVHKAVESELGKLKEDSKLNPYFAKINNDANAGGSIAFACATHAGITCSGAKNAAVSESEFKKTVKSSL